MKSSIFYILSIWFSINSIVFSQSNDPVLFTIQNQPVKVSEFEYIYTKNNGKEADFSKASLEEYLNLYIKFKLKVQAARDMKLDTIPTLIKELEGYRQQLTTNYLNDKEVTDKLAKEVYERQKKDLKISHILFSLNNSATPSDTLKAYEAAMQAYREIMKSKEWDAAVKKYSNDLNTAQQGGSLGWVTAMLPDGFFHFENTIYQLKKGEISYPVRSRLGFHLIRLDDIRPARRKMEAAHILFRKSIKGKPDILAKGKVDSAYQVLSKGGNFEELARLLSEDKTTSMTGGTIGYFGINQYESSFEDAAFALERDGQVSAPVETSIGWHLIKRLKREEELPYERAKKKIQSDISRDSRFKEAQGSLIGKIKAEAGYSENAAALDRFAAAMDTNFFTYKWKAPEFEKQEELGAIGNIKMTNTEFAEFVKSNTRLRVQGSDDQDVKQAIRKLFDEMVAQKCLQYEEGRLEDKYPEFKSLMREYREGILLFEATKNVVWDRAAEDSLGLRMFYEKNKSKYQWDERAIVYYVAIDTPDNKIVGKIQKYMQKKTVSAGLDKFDQKREFISFQKSTVEKKNKETYEGLEFKKASMTGLNKNASGKGYHFKKIEQILPPSTKTLDEARGFIIADYQDYLEALWVDELKAKYPVNVNQETLNALVKM
ncbi:MAG: peptidylprolyl isomerase [Saprospiraceae bacterium]|nr:peptidylprolyl isomerase [Saprospiraceae bacterium]